MTHFLFWLTLGVGVALIIWAMQGNGSEVLMIESPLYIDIFFVLVCTFTAIVRGISIWRYFFER